MPQDKPETTVTPPTSESTTITVLGVHNFVTPDAREIGSYDVKSYTVPSEDRSPSSPLDESAVRIGNSLLEARVPEAAFRRDESEAY